MSFNDVYCDRCDVFGHCKSSDECHIYWSSEEAPFGRQMKALEGTVMKLGDIPPDMWPNKTVGTIGECVDLPPGTFVRILRYTPWREGLRSGNYFTIETLDGEFSGDQVHLGELQELDTLDKLSLIKDDFDGPRR